MYTIEKQHESPLCGWRILQNISEDKMEGMKFARNGWGGFWQVVNGKVIVFTKDGQVTTNPWWEELLNDDWFIVEIK